MSETNGAKLVYSIQEAASKLGVSKNLCYTLAKTHQIPSLKLGPKRIVVPVQALEELLRSVADQRLSTE